MSSHDIPKELRPFCDKFADLAYGQDDSAVFDDLLGYIIDLFSFDNPWQPRAHYKAEEPELRKQFFGLFQEIVALMAAKVRDEGDWYDPFGHLYETMMASASRRANAGQFFTPASVVDLSVAVTVPNDMTGQGKRVGDPACGSGRFLIAFHAKHPGNFCCAEDIDRTCALMTVCNFILHGVNGEVVWHDSLSPDTFYDAWRVYPRPDLGGIAEVSHLAQQDTVCFQAWQHRKEEHEKGSQTLPPAPQAQASQLMLF